MENKKIYMPKNNIKELRFFNTTKDLKLKDGSFITKGTEFIIEENNTGKYNVHFSANNKNIYKNQFGNDYKFSLEQIKDFSQLKESLFEDQEDKYNNLLEKLIEKRREDAILSDGNCGSSKGDLFNDEEINFKDVNKFYNILKANNLIAASNTINDVIIHHCNEKNGGFKVTFHIDNILLQEWHYDNLLDVAKMLFKMNYKLDKNYTINNKLTSKGAIKNINNQKIIDRVEKIFEGVSDIKLKANPIKGSFDFKHLNDINRFKYKNLYELPSVQNEKIRECKAVLKELKTEKISSCKNIDQFLNKTTKHISKIYNIDVFQKGNVSTLKEFTRNLGMAAGFDLNLSKIINELFEFALIKATETGDFNTLNNVIKDNCVNIEPNKDFMKIFQKNIELEH